MKTSELEGAQLDYWVAKAEGLEPNVDGPTIPGIGAVCRSMLPNGEFGIFSPCYDWRHGGPIIEREGITLMKEYNGWYSEARRCKRIDEHDRENCDLSGHDPSPLVAAMRAYVASKFGDEVEG